MFCQNCGNQIPDNVKFCPICGGSTAPLASEPVPQTQPYIPPVSFDDDATVMAPPASAQPAAPIPPAGFEFDATVMAPSAPAQPQPEAQMPPVSYDINPTVMASPAAPVFEKPQQQPVFQQESYFPSEQPSYADLGYSQQAFQQPPQTPYGQPAFQQPSQPVFQQQMPQPAPKKSKAPVIVIAVLAVIAVAAIVFGVLVATDVIDFDKDNGHSVSDSDREDNDNDNGDENGEDEEKTTESEGFVIPDFTESTTDAVTTPTQPVTEPETDPYAPPTVGTVLSYPHITPDNIVKKVRYKITLEGVVYDATVDTSNPDELIIYFSDFDIGGDQGDIMYVRYSDGSWGYYVAYGGQYYEVPADAAETTEFETARRFVDLCGYGTADKSNTTIKGPFTYNGTRYSSSYNSSIETVHSYSCDFAGADCEIHIEPTTGLIVYIDDGSYAADLVYTALGENVSYFDFRDYTTLLEG